MDYFMKGQGYGKGHGKGKGMGFGRGRGRGMGYGRGMGLGRGMGYGNRMDITPDNNSRRNINTNSTMKSQTLLKKAYVDKDRCVGCGICEDVCNVGAISIINGVAEIDIKKCIGCGDCINVCPQNAISLKAS